MANHHIAPGKKQWTWGNDEFGRAWDRNLTDHDGPYIELMAGVYTDNQPDFSFLAPWETRTFEQYWYPIQEIGPAQHGESRCRYQSETRRRGDSGRRLRDTAIFRGDGDARKRRRVVAAWTRDLTPGEAFIENVISQDEAPLRLSMKTAEGHELIAYQPQIVRAGDPPHPATEPRASGKNCDER